jgi:hypothetical protein
MLTSQFLALYIITLYKDYYDFFFFFPLRLWLTTYSKAKFFGPSNFYVGDQGLVFHQVYKIEFDMNIEEVTS